MDTYELTSLPDDPIVISTIMPDFRPADLADLVADFVALLDAEPSPVYYVNDIREFHGNFTDVLQITNQAARGLGAMLHHPNMREFVAVTPNKLFGMAAKGLNSDVFGNVPVSVFETVDEALTYCREQMAADSA